MVDVEMDHRLLEWKAAGGVEGSKRRMPFYSGVRMECAKAPIFKFCRSTVAFCTGAQQFVATNLAWHNFFIVICVLQNDTWPQEPSSSLFLYSYLYLLDFTIGTHWMQLIFKRCVLVLVLVVI